MSTTNATTASSDRRISVKIFTQLPEPWSIILIPNVPASATVGELKLRIHNLLESKPPVAAQRLIHRGRFMPRDDESLETMFGAGLAEETGEYAIHLVIRPQQDVSIPPAQAAPIPAPTRTVQFQPGPAPQFPTNPPLHAVAVTPPPPPPPPQLPPPGLVRALNALGQATGHHIADVQQGMQEQLRQAQEVQSQVQEFAVQLRNLRSTSARVMSEDRADTTTATPISDPTTTEPAVAESEPATAQPPAIHSQRRLRQTSLQPLGSMAATLTAAQNSSDAVMESLDNLQYNLVDILRNTGATGGELWATAGLAIRFLRESQEQFTEHTAAFWRAFDEFQNGQANGQQLASLRNSIYSSIRQRNDYQRSVNHVVIHGPPHNAEGPTTAELRTLQEMNTAFTQAVSEFNTNLQSRYQAPVGPPIAAPMPDRPQSAPPGEQNTAPVPQTSIPTPANVPPGQSQGGYVTYLLNGPYGPAAVVYSPRGSYTSRNPLTNTNTPVYPNPNRQHTSQAVQHTTTTPQQNAAGPHGPRRSLQPQVRSPQAQGVGQPVQNSNAPSAHAPGTPAAPNAQPNAPPRLMEQWARQQRDQNRQRIEQNQQAVQALTQYLPVVQHMEQQLESIRRRHEAQNQQAQGQHTHGSGQQAHNQQAHNEGAHAQQAHTQHARAHQAQAQPAHPQFVPTQAAHYQQLQNQQAQNQQAPNQQPHNHDAPRHQHRPAGLGNGAALNQQQQMLQQARVAAARNNAQAQAFLNAMGNDPNAANDQVVAIDLTPFFKALWLFVRIYGMMWLFLGGTGTDWLSWRMIALVIGTIVYWAVQANMIRPEYIDQARRYWEGLLGIPPPIDVAAAAANPAQPPPAVPTRQQMNAGPRTAYESIREFLRPVERTLALFVASLYPGVGERHVAERERQRREELARVQQEEAARVQAADAEAAAAQAAQHDGELAAVPEAAGQVGHGSRSEVGKETGVGSVAEENTQGISSSVAVNDESSGVTERRPARSEVVEEN